MLVFQIVHFPLLDYNISVFIFRCKKSLNKGFHSFKMTCTIPDTQSWPQLTNMCELVCIEYNPTFDLIMPFPCFFNVTRKTS
jgi:hypothetical protein